MGSDYLMDTEFQFQKIKKVLKVNGGGGCTHTNVSVRCFNSTELHTKKMVKMVNFVMYILPQ